MLEQQKTGYLLSFNKDLSILIAGRDPYPMHHQLATSSEIRTINVIVMGWQKWNFLSYCFYLRFFVLLFLLAIAHAAEATLIARSRFLMVRGFYVMRGGLLSQLGALRSRKFAWRNSDRKVKDYSESVGLFD